MDHQGLRSNGHLPRVVGLGDAGPVPRRVDAALRGEPDQTPRPLAIGGDGDDEQGIVEVGDQPLELAFGP